MRVYLAATLPLLRDWLARGAAIPGAACAVTPALREWYREGDEEELEYAAQVAAARQSLRLLADDPDAPRRRVVVAADVPDAGVASLDEPRGAIAVEGPVPLAAWASALVDADVAQAVVSGAVQALPAADLGDEDAHFAVDEAEAEELAWYAVQELPHLLER